MLRDEQALSVYTSDIVNNGPNGYNIDECDLRPIRGPHGVTDTRIVACLVGLSPAKHIANAGIGPLIFGGGGDIKVIVADAFLCG